MPASIHDTTNEQFLAAQRWWREGDVARSELILREIVGRHPAHEEAAMFLATLLRNQGRLDAASHAAFDLCRARAFDRDTCLRAARFMQECQRQGLADELCREVLARGGVTAEMWVVAGHVAREIGDFERARACYVAALEAGVDLEGHAVLGALGRTLRYGDPTHPDFARFIRHFGDSTGSPRARAATGFGLAKAYDDIGNFESAARTLREANAMVHAAQPWAAGDWKAFVGSRMRDRVTRTGTAESKDFVPVFIVGLPRSGTTLAATQLAKFSSARDRGELRTLRFIADTLIGGRHLGDRDALIEAKQLYMAHARQDDAPARWYIDQDPLNFRYLDIAAAMFPQARIVHCRRNLRDTALSLWGQDFAHPDAGFAYDFGDIAAYARGHDEVMLHWRRVLPLLIHELDY
ncbi:MAG TPA: sulfotransferase, partial [Rhodanobacteraceae bacterium]|nr:sulfotransferase [Rhodanobacteraceae bacterium]